MNNSVEAKNGFKTFITTLLISLAIFGGFYYLITSATSNTPDIETTPTTTSMNENTNAVAGIATTQNDTAFANLATQRMDVQERVVLAGATESTMAVPNTGTTEVTIGFILATIVLGTGIYLIAMDPRKYALKRFEDDVMKNL